MPTWSNQLPSTDRHIGFDLRRTPHDHPLTAIVTTEDMIGCYTHYWGGRTVPCEKPDCPACNATVPFRWHSYVSAFDPKTRDHFIFECTANAAKAFEDHKAAHSTLRGCYFIACRPKRSKNSKVEITTKPADLARITLPNPPDLIKALSVIWRLPGAALMDAPPHGKTRGIKPRGKTLTEMREQPFDVADPPTMAEILSGNGEMKNVKTTA